MSRHSNSDLPFAALALAPPHPPMRERAPALPALLHPNEQCASIAEAARAIGLPLCKEKRRARVRYDPSALWPMLFEAIANGASLGSALQRLDPSPSYAWAKGQLRGDPELRAFYQQAVEDRADRLAEELIELADTPIPQGLDGPGTSAWVQRLRLQIDVRKWAASKLRPRVYGDRLDLTVDQPRISVLEALRMAEQRVDDSHARFEQDTDAPRAYLGNQSG